MASAFLVRHRVVMVFSLALAALARPAAVAAGSPQDPAEVVLKAEDGVVVHGLAWTAASPKALILLFHQAGSSKGEYASIAPRLGEAGYATLAIDQRAGGNLFGRNETAAALHGQAGYGEAKRDLEAALHWGEAKGLPIILWGSSYSASLVFVVAAEHPHEVEAVLAFSPGEYFGAGTPIRNAAARVKVPIFVTSAQDQAEIAAARAILAAAPARVKVQYVPRRGGQHGASTLIAARNPGGAGAAWRAVLAFLAALPR